MLSEIAYKLQILLGGFSPLRKLNIYHNREGNPKGRALVSYMPLPVMGDAAYFRGHSNVWESAEIVRILNQLGYAVDLIHWKDAKFVSPREYDAIFDIHGNLTRYATLESRTIFHVTGSNPEFSNRAEEQRLNALRERRGVLLAPRRSIGDEERRTFAGNLARADLITLIGNEVTSATFPVSIQGKIHRVVATGSYLPITRDAGSFSPGKEFLWFNGAGAVHKGLDLAIEVFARNPELVLHLVGPYLKEKDFVMAYRRELTESPNIHSHGFVYPASRKFRDITSRVTAFISPSCSEGISTSAITCMQYGMIPLISERSGINLPPGVGSLFSDCSIEEIETAVLAVAAKNEDEIRKECARGQIFASQTFSREEFSRQMMKALQSLLHCWGEEK
jgi:glycosyltransferase involved in cell wall biosynthesis